MKIINGQIYKRITPKTSKIYVINGEIYPVMFAVGDLEHLNPPSPFICTYGMRHYGKRVPIETENQFVGSAEGIAFINRTRVTILYLMAVAEGAAKFLPKVINKKITGEVEGSAAIIKKAVSFCFSATCETGAKITKHVILTPISAACECVAVIKKQVQKILRAVVEGLASIRKRKQLDFEFTGSFNPGDVVKINSKTLEVTLNGENALHLVGKDNFPMVRPGEQVLTYVDEEGVRKVRVKVQWRDRWV